ncbi:MAG: hypothetical protein EPO09_21160 [Aquabacterium sp.]|uniref:hypothetical protein n=1 Tax=Aquabacterium sp. TaxID=1872578 RepID=UPI0012038B1F|nr:hypothetical protein [Aquabacterium sp.]TAK83875.1 MAG: hypothetical protein EPO09_21160 [Aquabacterium sp.]
MKEKKERVRDLVEPIESVTIMESEKPFDPEFDEITKLEHFEIYNRWARKNKVPVKAPTEDFYPKYKVKFQRFDQPDNVLKIRVRKKEIDWQGQLKPGKTYNLCLPVIQYLNSLCEPIFAEVKVTDGSETKTETKQVGERSRFSCQAMEFMGVAV